MLKVENIYVNYGAIKALQDVSFSIKEGEIVALIGANGAGKTTILNTISNIVPSVSGKIIYKGKEITKTQPHDIVKLGISQSPEGRRIFTNMSVEENLKLGAFIRNDGDVAKDMEDVLNRFPRLRERFKQNSACYFRTTTQPIRK